MNQKTGFLKSMQVIFGALFMGQAMLGFVLYFIKKQESAESESMINNILPLAVMSMIVVGYFIFNTRLKALVDASDLDTKKGIYRSASLIKWALFEAATLFSFVCYLSFGNILFFYIGWLSLAHFIVHFPSQERVVRELATDDLS
jgi:hypothetical protein